MAATKPTPGGDGRSGTTRRVRTRSLAGHRNYAVFREYKGVALEPAFLERVGAHAVGIGRKLAGPRGEATNRLSLRFYVAKKRGPSRLSKDEQIPARFTFLSRKRSAPVSITTDVIETPPAQFEAFDPEIRHRPVPGGVSVGAGGTSGTLGGWVWDERDGSIVMLSNHHVFGDTPGVGIVQQSVSDGGSPAADRIGTVKRGVPRSTSEANLVDCAIGDPDSPDLVDLRVADVGAAVFAIEEGVLDREVEKYGQTTGHTFGEITDADLSIQVSGRPFTDCLRIGPMPPSDDWSKGGDSGALVFARAEASPGSGVKAVVGLHFAGQGTAGIACKIHNVFAALDLATLSAGAFGTFLDGLFEAETVGAVSADTEARLRTVSARAAGVTLTGAPHPLTRQEQRRQGPARSFHQGISGDLRARLDADARGRQIAGFLSRHEPEVLELVLHRGDIRRATVAALRPLVAGCVTTTDVLERVMTEPDLVALRKLRHELERHGSDRLRRALRTLESLGKNAVGRSIADILGLQI